MKDKDSCWDSIEKMRQTTVAAILIDSHTSIAIKFAKNLTRNV